ncbi:uncharacterized protein LOC135715006 [Ochlerotatus camptorhynchus]|uniref:uncharacterized protein LOC135715006 n=1 Tax=Ochlerotatus camptorhynchus TaxID=644619 RepID=UPI0031DDB24C
MEGETKVFLLVYVDDMLLSGISDAIVKKIVHSLFELTDLGEVRHFLGIEVLRGEDCYRIRLKNYIEELISKNGMHESKTTRSPMDHGFLKDGNNSAVFEDATKYRCLVGGLLYLSVVARPDIAASTSVLGRSFSAPSEADWTAAI